MQQYNVGMGWWINLEINVWEVPDRPFHWTLISLTEKEISMDQGVVAKMQAYFAGSSSIEYVHVFAEAWLNATEQNIWTCPDYDRLVLVHGLIMQWSPVVKRDSLKDMVMFHDIHVYQESVAMIQKCVRIPVNGSTGMVYLQYATF
jgi:hypothetical protein